MQASSSILRNSVIINIGYHYRNYLCLYHSHHMQVGSSNLRARIITSVMYHQRNYKWSHEACRMQVGSSNLRVCIIIIFTHHHHSYEWLHAARRMQVGNSNLRASTSLDAPGSSGLHFELNNLRNELRSKQREHSATEEEVKPCCHELRSTLTSHCITRLCSLGGKLKYLILLYKIDPHRFIQFRLRRQASKHMERV